MKILEAIAEMEKQGMDINAYNDMLNFQRDKKGGRVTFGVANPNFDQLINQAATGKITHYAIVVVFNREQFDKISQLESKDN